MHSQRFLLSAFNTRKLVVLITVACLFVYGNCMARKTKEKAVNVVRFAMTDSVNVPLKQILAHPELTTTSPDYKITGFTVGMFPSGGNYFGPYILSGGVPKLDENLLNFLREFTTIKVRIFIEDIHLTYKGRALLNQPLARVSIP